MARLLSIGGLTGGFLVISPSLRTDVLHGYSRFVEIMNDCSPWSYIAVGAVIFVLLTAELYRFAVPRGSR